MSKCWICNEQEAETGEHIFKHTILRDLYGGQRFEKGNRLIVWAEKTYSGRTVLSKKHIESTDSDSFKFKKSLCENCNGSKSREWDDGFDNFIRYLLVNWESSLANGYVNLKEVHAKSTKKDTRYLYNYFCKLFGCVLFTNGQVVPKDIVEAVNGRNYQNSLGVNVVFDIDLENISEPSDFLVNHDLTGDSSGELNYRWALGFGPIKLGFWFKTPKQFVIGEQWFGKSTHIPFTTNM